MTVLFNHYYYFALVVEHGGFSATERATHIAKSKLSRHVNELEQQLGVRLIQRNSRQFSVTNIGLKLYEQAKLMQQAAEHAQDLIHQQHKEPRGLVRLSVPHTLAQKELADILPRFLAYYPDIQLQLFISNRRYDIIHENIDLALRIRDQLDNDQDLIVRHLATSKLHLCASPDYLAQYGTPTSPHDLHSHRIISKFSEHMQHEIHLHHRHGQQVKLKLSAHVVGDDFIFVKKLVQQHCGIALLPDSLSAELIQSQQLVYVLPEWHLAQGIVHLVYPNRHGVSPAVRALINFLTEELTESY